MAASGSISMDELLPKVIAFVKEFMSHYDPSHDWNHILRVYHLAQKLQAQTPNTDPNLVKLCALMHDVGDRKYLKPGQDASRQIYTVLTSLGASTSLAEKVQAICLGVSYFGETKDPARVAALIREHPELAVVQDADRLDAIGVVGAGRTFAFGGARNRSLDNSVAHFEVKLVKLEGMMKTELGRKMAKERTDRIKMMQAWWKEETDGIGVLSS